jgi:hypothetical protein
MAPEGGRLAGHLRTPRRRAGDRRSGRTPTRAGLPLIEQGPNYVMFDLEGMPPQLDELEKIYLWGMQVFGERPGVP